MPKMRYASAFITATQPSLVTARTPLRMLETMSRKKRSSTGGGIGARRRRTGLLAAEERPREADCASPGEWGSSVCNGMGDRPRHRNSGGWVAPHLSAGVWPGDNGSAKLSRTCGRAGGHLHATVCRLLDSLTRRGLEHLGQAFPLVHQLADLPHQRLVAINDRLSGVPLLVEPGRSHRRFELGDRALPIGNAGFEV